MDALSQKFNQLLSRINNPTAVADVLIVALLVYGLLSLLQGTRATQVLRGAFILLLGLFLVSTIFQLPVLGWIVNNSLPTLLLVAAFIFAPELRRVLEQIGHTGDIFQRPLSANSRDSISIMVQEVADACVFLSGRRWGGLMVIERNTGLQDLIVNGQIVNGRVSSALLETIFMTNSELHDGAVIIRGDRIVAAHVTLPLADSFGKRHHLGHRHKAALGITEETDALAVIVSEETGNISVANNGELVSRLTKDKLREVLLSLLQPSLLPADQRPPQTAFGRVVNLLQKGLPRSKKEPHILPAHGETKTVNDTADHISRHSKEYTTPHDYPKNGYNNGHVKEAGKLDRGQDIKQLGHPPNKKTNNS